MAKKEHVNKLAPLKIKLDEKPRQTGDVIILPVEGDYSTQYNEASAIAASAELLMKDLKERMLPEAMAQLFDSNTLTPWEPSTSVALVDEKGGMTRVSFTKKYADIDAHQAEALFDEIKVMARGAKPETKPDINDYIARTVGVKFDNAAFLGPDGKFDATRFEKFTAAIKGVADELKIPNPLSAETSVQPLPSFHKRRWYDFSRSDNFKISTVIKNQVSFVPCPSGLAPTKEED
jgi:hypothetical protein